MNYDQYNSDKKIKGLFKFYEDLFNEYDIKGNLLEIGVLHGGSLAFYRDTGRFSKILGADINPPVIDLGRNVDIRRLDQKDREQLACLAKIYSDFNVVIDDGSHQLEHVIASFDVLWPHTKNIYVIEDWDVAYHWDRFDDWMRFIATLFRNKRELGAQEIRVMFDENPDSYHGVIMLRREG